MSESKELKASPVPSRRLVGWFLWGMAMMSAMVALSHVAPFTEVWHYRAQFIALTLAAMTAGVVFLLAMRSLARSKSSLRGLVWIVGLGFVMRLAVFTQPMAFETDFYRFMWDGAVTAHGVNPYLHRPVDIIENRSPPFATDPQLIALRESGLATLKKVNHPHLTTIYPPVAQSFFGAAHWLSPFDPNAIRGLLLVTEVPLLVLLIALLRHLHLPVHWIAIYWWNPVAIKEFYLHAHIDLLSALLATASVGAVVWGRRWLGIFLLALAVGAKLWPIVLAPLMLRYGARSSRQVLSQSLGFVVLSGILIWPLLASWGGSSSSGVSAYAHDWISNAGLMSLVDASTAWLSSMLAPTGLSLHKSGRFFAAGLSVVWFALLATRCIPDVKALARWSMIAVGGLFVISPTQFPWYFTWVLPFLVLAPSRALLAYSALLPLYHLQYEFPWVLWIEHVPVWLLLIWEMTRRVPASSTLTWTDPATDPFKPPADQRIVVIIPALNEERAIGKVIANIPSWVSQIVVVDNGSTDNTASLAKWAGATVVNEPRRGYGAACLTGITAADRADIVVFMDGDFSDIPQEMDRLVAPITRHEADMVIGSRVLGNAEPGSLTPQQRFGNALACRLIRLIYGVRYTDLGPFRAIHVGALNRLAMNDRDFGWTVQMQVRAARIGLRSIELPVSYRRRIGVSKISGTVRGVIAAGTKIISTIFKERFRKHARERMLEQITVMARYPEAGKAKTRMIPLLGATGASLLHRELVKQTLATIRALRCRRPVCAEVRFTGATVGKMSTMFGADISYRPQCEGDLGARLYHAAAEAFGQCKRKVILIGTDCPFLDADTLAAALASLEDHDVVLGPALDGGYYLIGLRAPWRELFEEIDWGESSVFRQTVEAAHRAGLRVAILKELSDVDTPDDLSIWAKSRAGSSNFKPAISIIIPVLNEQTHLAATIASALCSPEAEVIVVDGGSSDRTRQIAQAFGVTFCDEVPSRGLQLNTGATIAIASTLLFLHGDTLLPAGYAATALQLLRQNGVAAGAFRLSLDAPGLLPRIIEGGVRIRSQLFGRPYGDQAIFMRRETFELCGGFPRLSRMEDYAMLARLHYLGEVAVAHTAVLSSARRWKKYGWVRTTVRHQWLIIQFNWRCVHRDRRSPGLQAHYE